MIRKLPRTIIMSTLNRTLLQTQQLPLSPHWCCQNSHDASNSAPIKMGPGMEPITRKIIDCIPRAKLLCSSAMHLQTKVRIKVNKWHLLYLNVMTTLGIWEDNDMITPTAVMARYGTSILQLSSQYPLSALSPLIQVQFSNIGFCKQQMQLPYTTKLGGASFYHICDCLCENCP